MADNKEQYNLDQTLINEFNNPNKGTSSNPIVLTQTTNDINIKPKFPGINNAVHTVTIDKDWFGFEKANSKIFSAVNLFADTIKVTLGYKGRLVLYNRPYDFEDTVGAPILTKDGVTIAKNIKSSDPTENMVIQILRQACQKTVDQSGDGTTTTAILAQKLINDGAELLSTYNSNDIDKGIDLAVSDIVEYLTKNSQHIDDDLDKIKLIASISANDEYLGSLIHKAYKKIGIYGNIDIHKNRDKSNTTIEIIEGLKIDKGYMEEIMANDKINMKFEAFNCNILIFDDVIRDYNDIAKYIKASVDYLPNELNPDRPHVEPKPLLIYAKDVAGPVMNRIKGLMRHNTRPICIVEHDGFGDRREQILTDVGLITGALIVGADTDLDNPKDALGFCKQVTVDSRSSIFLEGRRHEDLLKDEIDFVNKQLASDGLSPNERKFAKRRLSSLMGGVAIITVGGKTPVEMEENFHRIEDAVLACRAAIDGGVSIGGGYSWNNASKQAFSYEYSLDKLSTDISNKDKGIIAAYNLVFDSIKSITKQLLVNAREENKYDEVLEANLNKYQAYDLSTSSFYPISEYSVYDATSVLTDSLTNAASVTKSILKIEKVVFNGILQ